MNIFMQNYLAIRNTNNFQRIQYQKQSLSKKRYKFYYLTVVMQKRTSKSRKVSNDCKQNQSQNSPTVLGTLKHKQIKKSGLHSLAGMSLNKNPHQLRQLCQQQQKLILAQYKSNKLFQHQEFYEYVRGQLASSSKICRKIMMIKEMSNEEAIEELARIEQMRLKEKERGDSSTDYVGFLYLAEKCGSEAMSSMDDEQGVEEHRKVFRRCQKKISMIQDNDDAYLQEIGAEDYGIRQQHIIQDQNQQRDKEQAEHLSYISVQKHQYYQNDDVFEF